METNVPIRALGFDLGDTLITYPGTPPSWSSRYAPGLAAAAKACGVEPSDGQQAAAAAVLAEFNTRMYPRNFEVSAEAIFARVLDTWCLAASPQRVQDAIAAFFGFFQSSVVAYPDARATLERLRAAGIRVGVLTDVPYGMPRPLVQQDVKATGLEGLVDALITSVDVGTRKPESRGYLQLAAELGVGPGELVYVGNEQKDVAGANAAGMRSVLVDRDGVGSEYGQQAAVASLSELFAVLGLT